VTPPVRPGAASPSSPTSPGFLFGPPAGCARSPSGPRSSDLVTAKLALRRARSGGAIELAAGGALPRAPKRRPWLGPSRRRGSADPGLFRARESEESLADKIHDLSAGRSWVLPDPAEARAARSGITVLPRLAHYFGIGRGPASRESAMTRFWLEECRVGVNRFDRHAQLGRDQAGDRPALGQEG